MRQTFSNSLTSRHPPGILYLPIFIFLLFRFLPSSAQALPQSNVSANKTIAADNSQSLSLDFKSKLRPLLLQKEKFLEDSLDPHNSINLSLHDCINLAFKNNPSLQETIANLRSSRELLIAAQRSWNPTISANSSSFPGLSYRNTTTGDNNRPPNSPGRVSIESNEQSADLSLTANWTFLSFTRQPNINSASSNYNSSKYLYYAFSRSLISEVETAYFQLLAADELIKSYSSVVDALILNADAIDAKFGAGRVSLLDVGQVYGLLFDSINSLIIYINDYRAASSRLSALVSLPQQSLISPSDSNQFYGEWSLSLADSIQSAIDNNELIKASLEQSTASRWSGIRLLNSALPQFYVQAAGLWSSQNQIQASTNYFPDFRTTSASAPWSSRSDLSVFLGFNWSLYQGGVNTANASSNFSTAQSLIYKARGQQDNLTADIRSSYSSLAAYRLSNDASLAAIESSRVAYYAAMARLGAGLADITTVNQTVQLYQTAIRSRALSFRDYNTALSRLYKATAIWPPGTAQVADIELAGVPWRGGRWRYHCQRSL